MLTRAATRTRRPVRRVELALRVPLGLKNRLAALAMREHRSVNVAATWLLAQGLDGTAAPRPRPRRTRRG